jgi:hypothetical protein
MDQRCVKVAQVGCGAFAASQDMRNYQAHPRVECVWRSQGYDGPQGLPA